MKTISDDEINSEFGPNDPPKDEELIRLISDAYQGELLCHHALIKAEGIIPFSDFQPKVADEFKEFFASKMAEKDPIPLFVYPKDGKFIMSDDYNCYSLYKELKFETLPCVVIGEATGEYVVEKSDPFKLPLPTFETFDN